MNNRSLCLLFLALFSLGMTGCPIIAGTIDSVRRAGLTQASREGLLQPAVSRYNEAIGWGDISLALSMVTDEYRPQLRDELLRDKDKIKVIESRVDLAEFSNSAFEATVFITFKAYIIPYYIAEPHKVKQTWAYSMIDGWKLSKREILEK